MTDVVCFIILCVGLGSEKYLLAMNFSVSLLEYLKFCKMGLCVPGIGELTICSYMDWAADCPKFI